MTLGDYIDLVCAKMHRSDVPSREEARKYIRSRYRMIYEGCAWRDVCEVMIVPVAAEQVIILPAKVDRIIGIRWSNAYSLRGESLWTVLSMDPNRFDQIGNPMTFSIYSPSGTAVSPGGSMLHLSTGATVGAFQVSIYGSYQNRDQNELLTITGSSGLTSSSCHYDDVYSLSKSAGNATLEVSRADNGSQLLTLRSWEKERKHQRIHFHSTPFDAVTALLCYKKTFSPLVNDSDAPEISGIDNALLAAATSDMLEGQRQYGKASAKMTEAVAMISTMADMERHQSANLIRIIPDPEPDWGHGAVLTGKDYFLP